MSSLGFLEWQELDYLPNKIAFNWSKEKILSLLLKMCVLYTCTLCIHSPFFLNLWCSSEFIRMERSHAVKAGLGLYRDYTHPAIHSYFQKQTPSAYCFLRISGLLTVKFSRMATVQCTYSPDFGVGFKIIKLLICTVFYNPWRRGGVGT